MSCVNDCWAVRGWQLTIAFCCLSHFLPLALIVKTNCNYSVSQKGTPTLSIVTWRWIAKFKYFLYEYSRHSWPSKWPSSHLTERLFLHYLLILAYLYILLLCTLSDALSLPGSTDRWGTQRVGCWPGWCVSFLLGRFFIVFVKIVCLGVTLFWDKNSSSRTLNDCLLWSS